MAWLTKSRFMSGLQCPKRLWFEIHQPLEEPAPPSLAMLQGRQFDEVVQQLQPGVVVSRDAGLPAAIAATKSWLAKGARAPATLYQPAFRAGDLAMIADVLRRSGPRFELIEVKASTELKETHLPDAAFQTLVLQRAKIPLGRVFIGHVNNQFTLRRAGDYQGLVTEREITETVTGLLPEIAERCVEFFAVMASASMPQIAVGAQCTAPYECPFLGRCTAGEEAAEFPVESLPRGGPLIGELLAEGHRDLRTVPPARLSNAMHRRVFDATVSGLAYFDAAATQALRALPFPFAYLDFETIGSAVPPLIDTHPYEPLPFQWSVHVEPASAEVRHAEYLTIESFGDFAAMAQALLAAVPAAGPIFAYNASFERRVLQFLADRVPALASGLQALADRLVDLLPITRAAYYHRDMRGSWSIKRVIPTIAPELAYESLDEVREGDSAQLAFWELRSAGVSRERAAALRQSLLRYCAQDTWALVVLRRFLCAQPQRRISSSASPASS